MEKKAIKVNKIILPTPTPKKKAIRIRKPKLPQTQEEKPLNPQQEAFCQYYGSVKSEYYSNAVKSYIMAYGIEFDLNKAPSKLNKAEKAQYQSAASSATKLLKKAEIMKRLLELVDDDDFFYDSELAWVAKQRFDLNAKMRGIEHRNELRGRIIKKSEVNNKHLILGIIQTAHQEAKSDTNAKQPGSPTNIGS